MVFFLCNEKSVLEMWTSAYFHVSVITDWSGAYAWFQAILVYNHIPFIVGSASLQSLPAIFGEDTKGLNCYRLRWWKD